MIYFADRRMSIVGQASYGLPNGLIIKDDLKTEEIDTGTTTFECTIPFSATTRNLVDDCTQCGNYILRDEGNGGEFYTIIESERDTKKGEVYVYAEDAGLDLLNEIAIPYISTEAHPIAWYINYFANDTGFEIGINEAADLSRALSWDGESTITERLASVAAQFDCELSYSFTVDGLHLTHKFINIYRERGNDTGVSLRLNYEINNIITSSSIANLATALYPTGDTPEGAENPITLAGYSYDDGDLYLENGYLKSREAVKKWSRYLNPTEPDQNYTGHILRTYTYDTAEQSILCAHAVAALKKACGLEINYEVDINDLPANVRVGDRVNIIDDAGGLYVSSRILKLETSIVSQKHTATLGEYLIKSSGVNQKVRDLANAFAIYAQKNKEQLDSIKTEVDPLKKVLTVDIDTNTIMIPCTPDGYPKAALSVTVTATGIKGGEVTADYGINLTGFHEGISCVVNNTEKTIMISVSSVQSIGESNSYTLTFTDNETHHQIHKKITVCGVRKGQDGAEGKPGEDGIDGNDGTDGSPGISTYVYIRYSPNSNGNPMSESPTITTKYIGIATTNSDTAPVYGGSYVWSKYVGEDAQPLYTWIKYADDAGGGGISDSPTNKKYIGIAYNKTTATESENSADYAWSLIKGEQGEAGADAMIYWMIVSVASINKNIAGQYTPSSITLSAKAKTGTNTPTDYAGRFTIEYSTDGASWSKIYTSSSNENTKTYSISGSMVALRCSLYSAGDTTILLDQKIIPVVTDGATGASGLDSYMYVRYSPKEDGSNMTDTPVVNSTEGNNTKFIGICTTRSSTAPTEASVYTWSEFTRKENITASFIRDKINTDSIGNLTHYKLDANALSIYGGAFAIYDNSSGNCLFNVDAAGCLCLSSPASDIKLRLVNDRISFVTGSGDEIAHISSSEFHIRNGVIDNSLRLGKFIFNPRFNGNLSLEWRG